MLSYVLMKKQKKHGDSLILLCGTHSLCLNRKKVRMIVCGLRVQPATTLSDSDQQQMRSKKSNKARMKCWFPDMLSQHPENCTDGLTELYNSVAKQPPITPLKQEKEINNKTPQTHRSSQNSCSAPRSQI